MRFRSHNGPSRIGRSASWSASSAINKPPLQRRSKALTQMRTWISCYRSLRASWVLYAGSINMTNAVDSLNVENIVEGSRCATALASHAGILEPLVLRFEEGGGSLPPGGSLWRKAYQGRTGSRSEIDASRGSLEARSLPTHEVLPRADPRSFVSAPEALLGSSSGALGSPPHSWAALKNSSALLQIPIVASCGRGRIFALAPGGDSKYTGTLTLVQEEYRRKVVIGGLEHFKVGS